VKIRKTIQLAIELKVKSS